MHAMEELRKTLEKELDKIAAKGTINENDLSHIDKLTHSMKSIDTIEAMQNTGYSRGAYPDYQNGGSYNSYDRGNSYNDGGYSGSYNDMGRYSRDGGYSYRRDGDGDGRYYEQGYSRGGSIRERLEQLMNDAQTETEREAIRRCMSQMKG